MKKRHYLMTFLLAAAAQAPLSSAAFAQSDPASLEARLAAQDAVIRELQDRLARLEKPAPATVATLPAPAAAPASAISLDTPTAKLRGRLQVDALLFNDSDRSNPTGTQVRRLYLGAEGKFGNGVRYQAEVDFAGNKSVIQDALIAWQATPRLELVAGYFKPAITADDMTSDVQTVFLERSAYAGVFAPGRRVGVGANYAGDGWGLRGGLFGEKDDATLDGDREEAWLASLRGSADLLPGDDVLHVALEGYYVSPSNTDGAVQHSQKPETNRGLTIIDTGSFKADQGTFVGAELAWAHGPFTVQLEGGSLNYDGPVVSPSFSGFSGQASWRLTGEHRPYDAKAGVFGRITPAHSVTDGGPGAIEAALRVTQVDLNDGLINGGKLTTYGAVVNWIPVAKLRLSGNLIQAHTEHAGLADVDETLLTIRTAIDW